MTTIVCVDQNWAIGCENELLFRVSADLRRFKEITMGHVLLMGRATFESLPGVLPGRAHVVLSRAGFAHKGVMICGGIEEGVVTAKVMGEVFVVGGGKVYEAMLPYCERALITQVDAVAPAADTYFPNLDEDAGWELVEAGAWQEENGLRYRYCEYKNRSVQKTSP